ncbi:MAG TPA: ABC transporter ATP-binding protein [Bacilli bacterium]
MSVIEIENLTKDYGFNRGVFGISFKISKGEVYGFLGPNGAGKSTTIRHLIGFSKPDSGKARIFGLDSFYHYSEILNRVGYIPGEIALPQGITGYEFIEMMKKLRGVKDDTLITRLLERFEVDPSGETKRMSFGNKRKLAIVAALMHDPEVLILDEPTSGLDPVMQEVFMQLLKEERAKGKTILLSSHVFSEVESLCDRVSIIKNGYIVDEFSMSKLKYADDKVYKVCLAAVGEANELKRALEEADYAVCEKQEGETLYIQVNDNDINLFLSELSNYDVLTFAHERLTLEDYFMQYYLDDIEYQGVSND